MSLEEIAWRLDSATRSGRDWLALKLGSRLVGNVSGEALKQPAFRVVHVAADEFRDAYSRGPARWRDDLLQAAERLASHRLPIFDLEIAWQDELEWHRDYGNGKRGPEPFAAWVDYRDRNVFGDCKLVWEPNRHHHWVVLARAYFISGERRFSDEVLKQYASWRSQNPFYFGMNWCSPLELGVRLINWVFAFDLIRDADGFEQIQADLCEAIQQHCWYIHRFQSKASSANNHLIGEAAGLFVASSYLPALPGARGWNEASRAILEQQIEMQTFDDGCTREHAFGYQFFVIQFFLICGLVARRTGRDFSEAYWRKVERMMEFLVVLGRAHGHVPLLGDCDDGYVLNLGDYVHDWRTLGSLGHHLFGQREWTEAASHESVAWLFPDKLGAAEAAAAAAASPATAVSRAFAQSGYYLLGGSDADGAPISVLFDCAELGFGALAAHGHADALSFVVSWAGEPVLVDSGTYDYFSYPEWRTYFRTTRAHNTLEIDGLDQSVISGPFMWSSRANAECTEWQPGATGGRVAGAHDGYMRLPRAVRHRRSLVLDASAGVLEIEDHVEGEGAHEARRYFHFDPRWQLVERRADSIVLRAGTRTVTLAAPGSSVDVIAGTERPGPGWFSPGYHRRVPCVSAVVYDKIDGAARLPCRLELSRSAV